jgi:hypothetical protein
MSNNAEHWLAEHETAVLERIYAMDSPSEPVQKRPVIRVDARKVRVFKRAPEPPSNGGAAD